MSVAVTGTRVSPGAVLCGDGSLDDVRAGGGCFVRRRRVVASRLGVVQWAADGGEVAVLQPPANSNSAAAAVGPRPGAVVLVRVARVGRVGAHGEIIAVDGGWCGGGFRGVVRLEDIRPFRPSKNQLTPPPPAAAFQAGDVIAAVVISQSDVRQYQLSTIPEECGVLEATITVNNKVTRLLHIPGRRDAMYNPEDNTVHHRWCPLIPLP
ncbi:putative exosome component CSL4 [Trypanosoma theileri]|uniref:Putative exosome component CSL4 n=1 Tax=Trypanosoma theileri TaxID=67003 RepID=A0A1X0NWN2_9TRYP|nr:putative exosome component CSL4 [Trypanosoma theileri]ORC89117.1 putative exosome component CSL4 [Trypanosoma theileri]